MKSWKTGFALMASCLVLAGCASGTQTPPDQNGGNNNGNGAACEFTGSQCNGSYVETCQNGNIVQKYCGAGCANGECIQESTGNTCDYVGSKCSDDGKQQLTCVGTQEMKIDCQYGCAYNSCKKSDNTNTDVIAPKVTGISPVSGKAGTKVTIKGENLSKIAKVFFASEIINVDSATATEVVATAPELNGMVMVGVIADDKRLTAGTFTYLKASENAAEVDWCQVTHVEPNIKPGESLKAYAQVFEEGVTGTSGTHADLRGQIGYIKADGNVNDTAAYTWVDAKRNESFNDVAAANNDEFMPENVVLGTGKYRVAYRFSMDGNNWQYCDTNGSQDGFSGDYAGTVNVAEEPAPEPATVGWCRIMNGETRIAAKTGKPSEHIYAQAFVKDCTHYQTHCDTLKAQVGYGPSFKSAIDDDFKWTDAELNTSYDGSGGDKHDEFMAQVTADKAGNYSVVYRMSVDNGETWTYCDTSDDVFFSLNDAVQLTVTDTDVDPENPPTPEKTVEWCRIVAPEAVNAKINTEIPVYAQVYIDNCTGAGKVCSGLKGEVGYGKATDKVGDFTYTAATYNNAALETGNNDEYVGTVKPTEAGNYAMAFRFSVDDGETWTYCDYDNEDGFKMENASKLTVNDTDNILWCRTILDGSQVHKGGKLDAYGQIWVENCSEGDKKCGSVKAQVGYGTDIESIKDEDWKDATYNDAVTTGNNDEYMASVSPEDIGTYKVAYRFSVDNGKTWEICDADDQAGFNADNMATMIVKDPIEWCQFFMNSPQTIAKGLESDKIYGQVFVADCSAKAADAACEELKAEIGYGTDDNYQNYKFVPATYVKDVGYNDEFAASIKPENAGEYKVVYAFSMADGKRKFCSMNGSKPFDIADAGILNVIEPSEEEAASVDYCQIMSTITENMALGAEQKVYAQAYVADCTQTSGTEACANLTAYIGYGKADQNVEDFTFTSATYFKDVGNNDEFVATLKPETAGEYQVIFAFSTDGGATKTYCTNTATSVTDNQLFDKTTASIVKVAEPEATKVGWCRVQHPETTTVKQGETSEIIFGQVFVKDCSENESKCAAVIAEAGYGTGDDMTQYTWTPAQYNEAHVDDNNDEYGATFTIGNDTVDTTYNVVYRFSVDNGQNWTYCDFAGSETFDINKAAKMKVEAVQVEDPGTDPVPGAAFVRGVDYSCGIDRNFANMYAESGKENAYYGQIWIPGCTDNGNCNKVVASHFHYINAISSREPITSTKWTVVPAVLNEAYTGTSNDEYIAKTVITNSTDHRYNYAFAYSFDLKHNPSDPNEKEQRVFCFIDWMEYGFGSLAVE